MAQLVAVILSTNGVDFQGIWHEFARAMQQLDGMKGIERPTVGQITGCFDPEQVKYAWDGMLEEAGVDQLLHVHACTGIVENGRVTGVIAETRAGRQAVLAKRVIDTTGDGIVAAPL